MSQCVWLCNFVFSLNKQQTNIAGTLFIYMTVWFSVWGLQFQWVLWFHDHAVWKMQCRFFFYSRRRNINIWGFDPLSNFRPISCPILLVPTHWSNFGVKSAGINYSNISSNKLVKYLVQIWLIHIISTW